MQVCVCQEQGDKSVIITISQATWVRSKDDEGIGLLVDDDPAEELGSQMQGVGK